MTSAADINLLSTNHAHSIRTACTAACGIATSTRATRSLRLAACGLASIAWLAFVPVTNAQALAPELITTVSLDASQKAQVKAFIDPFVAQLASGEQKKIQAARSVILDPLGKQGVSVSFRLELSNQLVPTLTKLLTDDAKNAAGASSISAINAIILAGELSTEQASTLITSSIGSPKADLRYQAAMALRRTLETIKAQAPAMSAGRALDLVRAIEDRIKAEKDPLVIDALVRAGLAAGEIRVDGFAQVRTKGLEVVSGGIGSQLKERKADPLPESHAEAIIRAGSGVRDAITGAAQGTRVDVLIAKAAADLGGQLIAHATRVVQAQHLSRVSDSGESANVLRERYAQIAQLGETLVLVSGKTLNESSQLQGKNLGTTLRANTTQSDANFALDARTLVGPEGVLSKAPFDFEKNRFLDK